MGADTSLPSYRGLVVASWDLLRGDTSGWPDRGFYLEQIGRSGEPVLDVGCGTGRLLLDYLALGVDVDGVDDSPEMLELCREKARASDLKPRLYLQRIEELALPRRYRTILVPSSTLQLLAEAERAAAGIARLVQHLEPRGTLVASFMELWRPGEPTREDGRVAEAERPSDGARVRSRERSTFDPTSATAQAEVVYEVEVDGRVVESDRHDYAVRSYTQEQARDLFARGGLGSIELTAGFVHRSAGPSDRTFCAIGTRPPH